MGIPLYCCGSLRPIRTRCRSRSSAACIVSQITHIFLRLACTWNYERSVTSAMTSRCSIGKRTAFRNPSKLQIKVGSIASGTYQQHTRKSVPLSPRSGGSHQLSGFGNRDRFPEKSAAGKLSSCLHSKILWRGAGEEKLTTGCVQVEERKFREGTGGVRVLVRAGYPRSNKSFESDGAPLRPAAHKTTHTLFHCTDWSRIRRDHGRTWAIRLSNPKVLRQWSQAR